VAEPKVVGPVMVSVAIKPPAAGDECANTEVSMLQAALRTGK
jgi:hypothetical protein